MRPVGFPGVGISASCFRHCINFLDARQEWLLTHKKPCYLCRKERVDKTLRRNQLVQVNVDDDYLKQTRMDVLYYQHQWLHWP